jgi:sortase A
VYSAHPKKGERLGTLSIPALQETLPIIEGTDASQLKQGVGHFAGSVLPGANDNCVLSGHRDTVFTGLGKLKVRDRLVVETAAGAFTYQIRRIRIVHKDDQSVIVPADHAVLTVTTCYPFNYVGSAPDRYILVADLVGP